MKASTCIEILCASHITAQVQSPWGERGAIILVAPPGQIKTTLLFTLKDYHGVYLTSDLNVQMLGKIRDDIISERIKTIVIPDIQKLYERHSMVSSNIEGCLRAMVEEGFIATSFQDASAISRKAKALFLSASTPSFYESHLTAWRQTGFARRVLFSVYSLDDPLILIRAIEKWKRVEITNGLKWGFPVEPIPYTLKQSEVKDISHWLRQQPDVTPLILLQKIACVLRWRYKLLGVKDLTMHIMEDFSESLSGEGAKLIL